MRGELRAPAASSAEVSIPVEILPEAQRLIDEADERWSTEHGFDAVNPLLDDILHAKHGRPLELGNGSRWTEKQKGLASLRDLSVSWWSLGGSNP